MRASVHISFEEEPWRIEKESDEYDRFTLDFLRAIPSSLDHVLVSGYPALLFGRKRNTEDIDMLVQPLDEEGFLEVWRGLREAFECINTSDPIRAYRDYLMERTALRFAKKGTIEPNMEFKLVKNDIERYALANRKEVLLNGERLWVGPMELQIAFKLLLGGDKDLEDARHLYEVARPILDQEELTAWIDKLDVPEEAIHRSRLEIGP